jgi:hypothetical protein
MSDALTLRERTIKEAEELGWPEFHAYCNLCRGVLWTGVVPEKEITDATKQRDCRFYESFFRFADHYERHERFREQHKLKLQHMAEERKKYENLGTEAARRIRRKNE